MNSDKLARQVQQLIDIEEIKQTKHKYIRLLDQKKWAEWGELFAEDCMLDSEAGVQHGPAGIVAALSQSIGDRNTIHRITMPEITFTGPDSADVIWGHQDVIDMSHDGRELCVQGFGYYFEEYVRTPSGWKIRRCTLKRRYTTQHGWADIE